MNYEQLLARLRNDLPNSAYQGGLEWWHWVIICAVAILFLWWLSSMFLIVRQKTARIVELLGKFNSVKTAGIGFKPPWPIGSVVHEEDLRIRELKETIGVKSKDNAFLNIPVKVQIQVMESKIKEAFYELDDPEDQIMSYVVNTVRSKANDMEMDEIFRSKDAFEQEVEGLTDKFSGFGFKIINVLVDDPQPSDQLKVSFDKVLAAQRDQEASKLEKEAIKNRVMGMAEAEAESLKLKASAYVAMRQIMAEGNSSAIEKFCDGLQVTHSEALRYFEGLDMRDAIRDAAANKGTVIITSGTANHNIASTIALQKSLE